MKLMILRAKFLNRNLFYDLNGKCNSSAQYDC